MQAIYNKHVNDDFKLFIVYHNITNSEVRAKYPLLADILATNSSKAFEKVTTELFEAAGLQPQLSYIYTVQENNNARLMVRWNKRLFFEMVSENYQIIGISADIEKWKLNDPHIIIVNFDTKQRQLYLMIDGKTEDTFEYKRLKLPNIFFDKARFIVGCSLELENPMSMTVSHFSQGSSLPVLQAKHFTNDLEELNKALGR